MAIEAFPRWRMYHRDQRIPGESRRDWTLEDLTLTVSNRPTGIQGRFGRLVLVVALWLLAGTASSIEVRETELFAALDLFEAGARTDGLAALERITENYPDFRAARLIRGSLLETMDLEAALVDLTPRPMLSLLDDPTDEPYSRLSYWFDRPPADHLPEVLIEAAPDRTKIVVADTEHSRLYLFHRSDEGWTMQGDWYASTGRGGSAKRREGDLKTPLGVYFVTMWVAGRYLSDFYGAGALGLNYPNEWDQHRRRDGFGIWIHGEPRGLKSRPPRWSQGCLIISNPALETLAEAMKEQSTPVIIGERLRWLAPGDHESRREEWRTRIATLSGGNDANQGLGIYGYPVGPGERATMILAEFRAGPEEGRRWWQYWRENGDGVWRIAHEGPASFGDIHLKGLPPRMPPDGLDRYNP